MSTIDLLRRQPYYDSLWIGLTQPFTSSRGNKKMVEIWVKKCHMIQSTRCHVSVVIEHQSPVEGTLMAAESL